ncbi:MULTISPECIES: lyase family protein [Pseudonocardia]|uniref:3-carboxy-cis,cis-muconate cycloisomerase n=2 Tax=Pseudonocardia TaxID=1847 RepID=A0A1Y2MIH2_PSEAH|nr:MULTISPECIES: lyase family protein [Pseudonocardia]OSY34497.1 3-carboxy-cis,cis-muconate cycloisomerase [Pseudonocardia autotrophica]TDN72441.1 3-carboxy-cis,cis-muconate cycloisomerase [Pseudonocardia autotrophica]
MSNSLFGPLSGTARVDTLLDDAAWIAALLEVELALSAVAAEQGAVDPDDADGVERAVAAVAGVDPAALAAESVEGGNPVIPLVKRLKAAAARIQPGAERAVHPGATSQDVLDTALMLLTRRAGHRIAEDLAACADAAAALAAAHRDTPCAARTLGQQALPSTFGLVAANWCAGLDRAGGRLSMLLAELPVQFGGAAGTLAASHPHGPAVADALATRLGLAGQGVPWHTERTRIGELAGALGVAAGACGKPATDVVALSGTELGEVSEAAPGDSSSMPHKRNPAAAVTARGAARRAPGLVATLLANADHEFQRAAGAWHAEWGTLTELLRVTAGAAARLRVCLSGLQVHPEAMARNLALAAGTQGTGSGHAAELVDRVLAGRAG